jgi:hypothetical protein
MKDFSCKKKHRDPVPHMMRRSIGILLFLLTMSASAQDTLQWVPYQGGMDLNDGVYLDFEAFRYNRPSVAIGDLRNDQGMPVSDIRRVVSKLYWQQPGGQRQAVRMQQLWGFCQNDVVYIQAGNGFYRIGMMGSLAHMMYEQTVRDWDPYMYRAGGMTRTYIVQQMLDMRTGRFLPFNASGIDAALQHDPVLLEEFRALPKKQRNSNEVLFRFLRLYNDRHPLEFPVYGSTGE